MRLDKLTIKAQEALEASQGIAEESSPSQVEPEHLLKALLDQADGIVRPVLAKVGADAAALDAAVIGCARGCTQGQLERPLRWACRLGSTPCCPTRSRPPRR